MNQDLIELSKGALVGATQVLIGHPLDTLKVWHQTRSTPKIITPIKLYRGITPPLMINGMVHSIFFGVSHKAYQYTNNWYTAGMVGGTLGSLIMNPFEVWKIQRQSQFHRTQPLIKPFRGLPITMFREMNSIGIYMSTYHYLRDQLKWSAFPAGCATGSLTWALTYQPDIVKSIVQRDYQITYTNAIKKMFKRGIWNGFMITQARGITMGGVGFYVYDLITQMKN